MEKEKKTIYDYLAYIIVFGIIGFVIFYKDPKIYEYKDGKYEIVDNCYGYKSMGDAETLKYFFNYVDKNYDTDEYILYFYGHGSGVGGFMFDEVYDDFLDLKETLLSFA